PTRACTSRATMSRSPSRGGSSDMPAPLLLSPDNLHRVLVHLPERRFTYLLRASLRVPTDRMHVPLPDGQLLSLAVADWLAHLGGDVPEAQGVSLLNNYPRNLYEYPFFL